MGDHASLRLVLTGDSMITRHALIRQDEATRELVRLIREADLAFTNLEVLPNDFRGYPAEECGGTHLAAPSWIVDELAGAGFDLFSCATNHALDYSIEGLLATIEVLERKGVTFAGIGRNLAEARMPVYAEAGNGTVALISCVSTFGKGQQAAEQRPDMPGRPGVNPLRVDTAYEVSPEQLATLRAIAEGLGLERQRLERIGLGFAFPPDDPAVFPFLEAHFRAADRPAIRTTPRQHDVDAIARWVREARARADIVIVSLHAHEQGASKEEPAEFIPIFAHRMIDAGADLVVGHGPHLLRGMEVYRGKPIFYSLGNFVAQNDLVHKLPAEAFERFRVDPDKTPGELFAARNQGGQRGFPADERYWQTVVPSCKFASGQLCGVELVPVALGYGEPVHRRGRPRRATGDEAAAILARFARLSEPFGARLHIRRDLAVVELEP